MDFRRICLLRLTKGHLVASGDLALSEHLPGVTIQEKSKGVPFRKMSASRR